jgi:hypothetical protein
MRSLGSSSSRGSGFARLSYFVCLFQQNTLQVPQFLLDLVGGGDGLANLQPKGCAKLLPHPMDFRFDSSKGQI